MRRKTVTDTSSSARSAELNGQLQAILDLVQARTGHDFGSYKTNTIQRRIERRMAMNNTREVADYLALLHENHQEAHDLCREFLIGVTGFFRDPEAFAVLGREVVPRLFAGRDAGDPVRIWHPCCSTGEEVYSMAILIREYLDSRNRTAEVLIFASDLDENALAQARAGQYSDAIEAVVGAERLATWFTRTNGNYQVVRQLREMVVFAHHSLVKDPPFSRLDLLVCRNGLIYLTPTMQKRLIPLFHHVLQPKGFLFLGASETIGPHTDMFIPIHKKWKIFQRRENSRPGETAFPPSIPIPKLVEAVSAPPMGQLAHRAEIAPGDNSSREALIRRLEEELCFTHEQLQVTVEQLASSNEGFAASSEELITINEEYQSMNEELQATNEELETSKEELQGLNEELLAVNAELQRKMEEINQTNSDMENLFACSEIAAIFLDRQLAIKRFSPAMAAIFNLLPADMDRPFQHLAGKLDWPALSRDAQEVLGGHPIAEREVTTLEEGRCYLKRVLPYRNHEGAVNGIVITLVDISEHKKAEETRARLAAIVESSDNAIISKGLDGRISTWNSGAERLFGYPVDEVIGRPISLLFPPELLAEEEQILSLLKAGEQVDHLETVRLAKDGRRIDVSLTASPVRDGSGRIIGASQIVSDITKSKQAEKELLRVHNELEHRVAERTEELATTLSSLRKETSERLHALEALRKKEQMLLQQSRLAAMGEMINNIAHQWRQPLNVLGLLVQQIRLFYGTDQFNQEFLDETVGKAMGFVNHMSQTIDDFRNFFKPDKEKVEFAIRNVVVKTLALVEESFKNQQIAIETQANANPIVSGYPNEYSQALLNILLNARDALLDTRPDRAKVVVTIGMEDGRSIVTITDNAGGITGDTIGKIFEPYFTTKGPDKGTGVGLFISKAIIEKNMNGRLTARNIADGAEFRIEV